MPYNLILAEHLHISKLYLSMLCICVNTFFMFLCKTRILGLSLNVVFSIHSSQCASECILKLFSGCMGKTKFSKWKDYRI